MSQPDIELGRTTANTHTQEGRGKLSLLRIKPATGDNNILLDATVTTTAPITQLLGFN